MYLEATSIIDFEKALQTNMLKHTAVVFVGEKNPIPIEQMIEVLKKASVSFLGGIFPAVFSEQGYSETGIVIKDIDLHEEIIHTKSLNEKDELNGIESLSTKFSNMKTAVVLVDGLSSGIAKYMTKIYDCFGADINYIGGGAGSLTLSQKPCLFTAEGIFEDGALLAFSKWDVRLGVNHGWERIAGPFIATSAEQTTVKQLNWQNAFETYKQFVEEDSAEKFTEDNFFDIAKKYPFGMQKQHQEYVVRDPITTNSEGHLVCVGKVPEHAVLDILKGTPSNLIDAAKQAGESSVPELPANSHETLIIDCISRVLFLENDFIKEVNAIKESWDSKQMKLPVEGVLTLGEISSSGDGLLEFYNKTIVSGVFY